LGADRCISSESRRCAVATSALSLTIARPDIIENERGQTSLLILRRTGESRCCRNVCDVVCKAICNRTAALRSPARWHDQGRRIRDFFASDVCADVLQDVVTRYAHQSGFSVERRFGWDCHGLPVEYEIDKKLGIKVLRLLLLQSLTLGRNSVERGRRKDGHRQIQR
jgi:hypothetical protein